jgi:hypothetical protein
MSRFGDLARGAAVHARHLMPPLDAMIPVAKTRGQSPSLCKQQLRLRAVVLLTGLTVLTVLTGLTVLTADRMDTVNEVNNVRRQSSQHGPSSQYCPEPNAPAAGGWKKPGGQSPSFSQRNWPEMRKTLGKPGE